MAEAITNVASVLESDMSSEHRTDLAKNLLGTMGTILTPPSESTDVSSSSEVKWMWPEKILQILYDTTNRDPDSSWWDTTQCSAMRAM